MPITLNTCDVCRDALPDLDAEEHFTVWLAFEAVAGRSALTATWLANFVTFHVTGAAMVDQPGQLRAAEGDLERFVEAHYGEAPDAEPSPVHDFASALGSACATHRHGLGPVARMAS